MCEEARSVGFPGAGITGVFEPHGVGTNLRSFRGAVNALKG